MEITNWLLKKRSEMIYLISNDARLREDKLQALNIKPEDKVLLFNHARPRLFSCIKNHANKYVMLRKNLPQDMEMRSYTESAFDEKWINISNQRPYWGSDKINLKDFVQIILISADHNHNPRLKDISKKVLFTQKEDFEIQIPNRYGIEEIIFPARKSITTGFYGFLYALKNWKDEICLVNFTGQNSFGMPNWWGHDYEFEQAFYKKHKVKII